MQPKTDIQLHLSIWRPAMMDRRFLYGSSNAGDQRVFVPIEDDLLLEQIYAWDTGPSDFLGSCSSVVEQQLKERLIVPFGSNNVPAKRTIHRFGDTVNDLLTDHTVQTETFWTDCQEIVKSDRSDDINLRANQALAVLRHFYWVASVFLDVPRASVLIR